MELSQQYCLKWNNHPGNISNVLNRLKNQEQFTDVTLASSDRKRIKCHKILLCAGSGYLEEILCGNPSDHPTVVLSQIKYAELKHLVDFMYAGEVAVEQAKLSKLLEAAKLLKIKGLWENDMTTTTATNEQNNDDQDGDEQAEDEIEEGEINQQDILSALRNTAPAHLRGSLDSVFNAAAKINPKLPISSVKPVVGSQKRKRKPERPSLDTKEESSPTVTTTKMTKDPKSFAPMFGISNAYFLTNSGGTKSTAGELQITSNPNPLSGMPKVKKVKLGPSSQDKPSTIKPEMWPNQPIDCNELPTLMNKPQLSPPSMPLVPPPLVFQNKMQSSKKNGGSNFELPPLAKDLPDTTVSPKNQNDMDNKPIDSILHPMLDIAGGLLASTPVRRYKQYTENSLQQALKEIIEGQSINRSSLKHKIPARTLRDWMKRLNIKSVFTHHSQNDKDTAAPNGTEANGPPRGSTSSQGSSDETSSVASNENETGKFTPPLPMGSESPAILTESADLVVKSNNQVAFPGMTMPQQSEHPNETADKDIKVEEKDTNEYEEEIDDVEEES